MIFILSVLLLIATHSFLCWLPYEFKNQNDAVIQSLLIKEKIRSMSAFLSGLDINYNFIPGTTTYCQSGQCIDDISMIYSNENVSGVLIMLLNSLDDQTHIKNPFSDTTESTVIIFCTLVLLLIYLIIIITIYVWRTKLLFSGIMWNYSFTSFVFYIILMPISLIYISVTYSQLLPHDSFVYFKDQFVCLIVLHIIDILIAIYSYTLYCSEYIKNNTTDTDTNTNTSTNSVEMITRV